MLLSMPVAIGMRRVKPANCPKCCLREGDTYYLGHFRRRAPPRQGRYPNEQDRDTPLMWPPLPEYGHQRTTPDKCGLVTELCTKLAEISNTPLNLGSCMFPRPSASPGLSGHRPSRPDI